MPTMGFQHMDKTQLSKVTSKGGRKSSSRMSPEDRSKRAQAAALKRWGAAAEDTPEVPGSGSSGTNILP